MERKLAAILAGDVVGYSRLMAENEAATYGNLRSLLDGIVAPVMARHQGRVFKTTGDGFLAAFASANQALGAAMAIQEAMEGKPLKLRIGLNLGDVIEDNGDVYGDGVNLAARLESMAEPGHIYVSAAFMKGAGRVANVQFRRIGRRRAKNLPDLVEVYCVVPRRAGFRLPASPRVWQAAALGAGALALAIVAAASFDRDRFATLAGFLPFAEPATAKTAANRDSRPVVAVLPFDNLSGDPAQAYFSDGLTEDIITELASNRELMVIARNSTFAFKGRATDIRAVGAELGAGYVVEGSARRSGDQLRVVAQLIDATTGAHLWSRSYDQRVADVFAVQADLTAQIVASLVSFVRQSEADAAVTQPAANPRAYDLVLQARSVFQQGSPGRESLFQARSLLERALALDADYASAHAYLGLTYIADYAKTISGSATLADVEKGVAEAREAIRLEPNAALGYQVLSYGLSARGEYEMSIKAGERAVELSPSDPDSLMALAKAQVRFGAYDEAVANAERARLLHPMAPGYYAYIHGQALYAAGRTAEADRVLAECLLANPREPNCLRIRAAALVKLGRLDDARGLMAQLVGVESGFSLAEEREYRRFGDSALMDTYLKDLAAAGAPQAVGTLVPPA